MVFNLIASVPNDFDRYRSHPDKLLRDHMIGVMQGVSRRTDLPVAHVSALFHDLGKLNPNFQPKLDGVQTTGYSSHAYLSARAFICFLIENPGFVATFRIKSSADAFAVVHAIAHHHGNLRDVKKILSSTERKEMSKFLATRPDLPVSEFLGQWLDHKAFDIRNAKYDKKFEGFSVMNDKVIDSIQDKLDFYLKTQIAFSSLVEADKRDAGNLTYFARSEQLEWAKTQFASALLKKLDKLVPRSDLDVARNRIREESVEKIETCLQGADRVFSLTAPTGSGKTLTLLALAATIKRQRPDHSVIYALPFLSITEQVEDVCRNEIFIDNPAFVSRIDSRSEDEKLDKLLIDIEANPSLSVELLQRSFSRDTFDSAFIVTTFVQFFETLLSNRGSKLLRLPNFSKSIFLIDEIQALPPRLYVFFSAYLSAFCELVDSYAILSTATMPALSLHPGNSEFSNGTSVLFPDYVPPTELLSFKEHYSNPVFDRYRIGLLPNGVLKTSMVELANSILAEKQSCLVILNTLDDTRSLYELLSPLHDIDLAVVLLNTHFILDDRRDKISVCKSNLKSKRRTILISTQLIEAGVDIDFPVVYRDLCPLPNLIQSAGRCNRNGNILTGGIVRFFELIGGDGKSRSEKVYRDPADRWVLKFSRNNIVDGLAERDLLRVQKDLFELVNRDLEVGVHPLWVDNVIASDNLIKRISECSFEIVGSFQLINKATFGNEYQFYVPLNDEDFSWEDLGQLLRDIGWASAQAPNARLPFPDLKRFQLLIDSQLRKMSGRTVQVRARSEEVLPPSTRQNGEKKEYCGIRRLMLPDIDYSSDTGIKLNGTGLALI
jgi:CRISPR-associated endonuclease/helicase Cas3